MNLRMFARLRYTFQYLFLLEDFFQHRFLLNVWMDKIGPYVLRMVFLPRLNEETYLQFLRDSFPELLFKWGKDKEANLERARHMYYQHDKEPTHFQLNSNRHLDDQYGLESTVELGSSELLDPLI